MDAEFKKLQFQEPVACRGCKVYFKHGDSVFATKDGSELYCGATCATGISKQEKKSLDLEFAKVDYRVALK